jgi:hypothetical protein
MLNEQNSNFHEGNKLKAVPINHVIQSFHQIKQYQMLQVRFLGT